MKKAGFIFFAVLFSSCLVLSSSAFAHEGEHDDSSEKGSGEHQKLEEGSGSSAVQSSHEKAEEYKANHEEAEEEGSFSYKRHRKEMKEKEKTMQEDKSTSGKMKEGS